MFRPRPAALAAATLSLAVLLGGGAASAQVRPEVERPLRSLAGVRAPAPPQAEYDAIVKDRRWLVALGKALFWDTGVGADGTACASCHFHAGADPRTVNQLNPGLAVEPSPDIAFGDADGLTGGGAAAGPNHPLVPADFPFHRLADPDDRGSAVEYDTNDVASSQGVFSGPLLTDRKQVRRIGKRDRCDTQPGAPWQVVVGGNPLATRRVEPRNSPTTINAAFNFRNFWDGRASNVFNGVDPFGRGSFADPTAKVLVAEAGAVTARQLALPNMSAASQAVGPVLSSFEMACEGKEFPDVARRLLPRRALLGQKVAPDDGAFSRTPEASVQTTGNGGLRFTYRELVGKAFQPAYTGATGLYVIDGSGNAAASPSGYRQDELNFALFFGLAVDAYERTLVSDEAPFDAGGMSDAARAGQAVFEGKGKCTACHDGPLFSKAATFRGDGFKVVERMPMATAAPALYDNGFYNIGVRPAHEDVGLGGTDPRGKPLSFARREASAGTRVAVDGAFKTPTLRNVALTAPYFHNGGQKSLEEVVAFYDRGGDRRSAGDGDTTGTGPLGRPVLDAGNSPARPGMGGSNLDPDIEDLGLSPQERSDLVEFLKALTDRRVACHAAPFDHPELRVPNGHLATNADGDRKAEDVTLKLRPVGAGGYRRCDVERLNSGDLFVAAEALKAMLR